MFNAQDYPGFELAMPVVIGAAAWFGLNYIFLAPAVIAPRLEETYFTPACRSQAGSAERAWLSREEEIEREARAYLKSIQQNAPAIVNQGTQSGLRALLGGIYGAQGNAYVDRYGEQLGGLAERNFGAMAGQITGSQIAEEYRKRWRQERTAYEAATKFTTKAEYCNCIIQTGMSQNFDMAAYTSTLRLYKPAVIRNLLQGGPLEQCGRPPLNG